VRPAEEGARVFAVDRDLVHVARKPCGSPQAREA
jgi:hypothetical protein